jgi:hypothetical protein
VIPPDGSGMDKFDDGDEHATLRCVREVGMQVIRFDMRSVRSVVLSTTLYRRSGDDGSMEVEGEGYLHAGRVELENGGERSKGGLLWLLKSDWVRWEWKKW